MPAARFPGPGFDLKYHCLAWTLAQSRELVERGAPCLHFYTMGRSKAVCEVAGQLF